MEGTVNGIYAGWRSYLMGDGRITNISASIARSSTRLDGTSYPGTREFSIKTPFTVSVFVDILRREGVFPSAATRETQPTLTPH